MLPFLRASPLTPLSGCSKGCPRPMLTHKVTKHKGNKKAMSKQSRERVRKSMATQRGRANNSVLSFGGNPIYISKVAQMKKSNKTIKNKYLWSQQNTPDGCSNNKIRPSIKADKVLKYKTNICTAALWYTHTHSDVVVVFGDFTTILFSRSHSTANDSSNPTI